MDATLPSSMQRFMIRVGLGKKKKVQRQLSHHSRRSSSGWVKGRPVSATAAKENVKSVRDEGTLARRSTSKSVASEIDPLSLDAQVALPNSSSTVLFEKNVAPTPHPKRTKTFLGTLTKKLRVRTPARRHTHAGNSDEPEHAGEQSSIHKRTYRTQAVAITLPNDIVSRERRAEALRARGLLPSRPQALSAIEAAEDRRIDALQVNDLSYSDSAHSYAKEIAQSWRTGNSMWLSLGPDAPVNLVPEVLISEIDVTGDSLGKAEADLPTSDTRAALPSVPIPLPSDARHSPVPCLRAASPAAPNDKQEARPSQPPSLRSPSSEGLTGLTQQFVPSSPHSEEDLPVGKPQTEIAGDADEHSSLLTPPLPTPSESSFLQQSHITEDSQGLLPTSSSPRTASPSRGLEDVPALHSPRLPPSPCSVLSPQPAPSILLTVPLDSSTSPQVTVPDISLPYLDPSDLDVLTASPTSPTVPSLLYSSSSEISHSTVFTDNGETLASPASYTMPVRGRRANFSPIMVKSSEGGLLCEDVIFETTETFPEDDLDPFAGPSSTAPVDLKVDIPAANPPRRKPLAFLGMAKQRASTLDPSSIAGVSKSASMTNLRRSMSTAFRARTRARSTLSPEDRSPPFSPLNVTMHSGASIYAQTSMIDDDETRRLSELAFM